MADAQPEDREVVKAVLTGHTDQFALLVRRYHGPLLHLAENRLGRADLAEDAVQDTFLAAFRSLTTYKPEFQFRTWLWTILLNQCRRHHSRLARTSSDSPLDEITTVQEIGDAPDLVAMLRERNVLLRDLLQRLPEPQADAIRLRFFGCLKYREIADAMDSSLSSAKQRVRVGLLSLSEMLREMKLTDSIFPGDTP